MSYAHIEIPAGAEKILLVDNHLQVPDHVIVPFIEGDGTGPDIWATTRQVIDASIEKAYGDQKKISWVEVYAGEKSNIVYGAETWLPEETLEAIREYKVALKGPMTTPVGKGIRSINVTMRQQLDLYVCLRPVRYFKGVPSPVKHPEYVDMTVFRENTEDIYAGIEFDLKDEGREDIISVLKKYNLEKKIRFLESSALGIKPISEEGSKRLVKSAIEYAIRNNKKSVTLVHKGNIMKYTEGNFYNWGYQVARECFAKETISWAECGGNAPPGKILVKDVIADAFLQQVLTRPREYDVIATMNLNGDYISDALAAQVGGIGIAPGANINYETGIAIFEATHGTAPKYAGLDKVNPSSLILSGEMMLRYLGFTEAADLIISGIERTIQNQTVTYDFARLMDGAKQLKCSEFGQAVIENMQ